LRAGRKRTQAARGNDLRGFAFILIAMALVLSPPASATPELPAGIKADTVLVLKGERRLLLLRNGHALESYRIALGRNPVGPKVEEGDGRTPEGRYRLDWRNPESRFHRSLHISYPNRRDRERARALGVSPGGAIMIHGLSERAALVGAEHVKWDWTEGCIAVTNAEIDRIWRLVDDGTAIEIRP
jgi:murein L,D-transpeptidase YafK